MSNKLYIIKESPWSEKAMWAFDVIGAPHERIEYTPFVGELSLRLKTLNLNEKQTVPVLLTAETAISDSLDIAQSIDHQFQLFPADMRSRIMDFDKLCDSILRLTRSIYLKRVLSRPELIVKYIPASFPSALNPISSKITKQVLRLMGHKHQSQYTDESSLVSETKRQLIKLQEAVKDLKLEDEFNYAVISFCTAFQFIKPVDTPEKSFDQLDRQVRAIPELDSEFSELFELRDRLYSKWRVF